MAQHLGRINNCAWLCPARAGASSIHVCATLGDPHNFFLGLAFSGPFNSPHAYATRACPTLGWPLSSYKPCTPHVLLCSPHGACQSCLSEAWCVFLLPSRAYAIRVCPTLGCSLSWIPYLGRINATRCEAVCSLCRCF